MTHTEVSLKALELIARAYELAPLSVEVSVTYGFSTCHGQHYTVSVFDCLRVAQRDLAASLRVVSEPTEDDMKRMRWEVGAMDEVLKGFCSERSKRMASSRRRKELLEYLTPGDRELLGIG